MKIIIGDKEITLVDRDVKTAKHLVRHFLTTSKEKATEQGAPTFYYTLLVVMYVMSQDYIKSLTPGVLSLILNAAAKNEEIRLARPRVSAKRAGSPVRPNPTSPKENP